MYTTDRVYTAVYTTDRVHGSVRAIYTAENGRAYGLYMAVHTTDAAGTRPYTRHVFGRVNGPYTAVQRLSTRAETARYGDNLN